jgi:hypothetical protein
VAISIVLAFADIALALSAGASADVNCALALATEAGIAAGVLPAASATSAFLVSSDFEGALRCADRFQCRVLGLTALPAVAPSGFKIVAALSALAAIVGDGAAKHTNSPVASINAERPLALIFMWQSPHLPVPEGEMRPRCVSTAGQKKGIFGLDRAKAGQRRRTVERFPAHFLSDCCLDFSLDFSLGFPWTVAGGFPQ